MLPAIVSSGLPVPSSPLRPLPAPRVAVSVRAGTMDDIPFMDELQKKHTKQVGFMPRMQLQGKVRLGQVLIAEEVIGHSSLVTGGSSATLPPLANDKGQVTNDARRAGYLIGQDQYFKRDDLGIIYQINVVPEYRRSFVAAALLTAQFDRSAWGCKLYCCWCAQDIEANQFWESMGFVPLAFRTGSRTKGKKGTPRVHIFWQKRVRQGDETTPWWFPSKTAGGSLNEDRIALPIPPGMHWRDAMPVVLPAGDEAAPQQLDGPRPRKAKAKVKPAPAAVMPAPLAVKRNGLSFSVPLPGEVTAAVAAAVPVEKPTREPRVRPKNDPRLVAAARELRDRWLDEVNAGRYLPAGNGKYDVARALVDGAGTTSAIALPVAAKQLAA